jgi:predicted transcriptional regulator of viral defense system
LDKFQTHSLLNRMEQAGLVVRIERGKFLLLGLTPEKVLSNPLYIGSNLTTPSYVSFWSALHYHGFTEQVPRTVFVATTHRKKQVTFREMYFQFVTLKPQHFFGYRRETLADLPVVIADEAKSILDALALPQYAGGIAEVAKALQIAVSVRSLDMPILLEYVERLQNASLSSRLGYLLELLGQSAETLQASKGPVKLDPQKPSRGVFNKQWQLYINVDPEELFPQGVV